MKKEKEKNLPAEGENENNIAEKALEEKNEKNAEDEKKVMFSDEEMEKDISLFKSLFPEVTGKDIPSIVWEDVENGIPLSYAYSLFLITEMKKKEEIEKVNRKNESSAPPKITSDGKGEEYFTPDNVKNMTREQVRKNYNAIIRSMEKWN